MFSILSAFIINTYHSLNKRIQNSILILIIYKRKFFGDFSVQNSFIGFIASQVVVAKFSFLECGSCRHHPKQWASHDSYVMSCVESSSGVSGRRVVTKRTKYTLCEVDGRHPHLYLYPFWFCFFQFASSVSSLAVLVAVIDSRVECCLIADEINPHHFSGFI